MAQISHRILQPAVKDKIQNLLLRCVAKCRDLETASNFIDDLLTSTEKIMISKRVAIALMILKEYTARDIEDILKVSLPTIYSVKTWLGIKGSGYRTLLEDVILDDERTEKEHEQAVWELENTTPRRGTDWKEEGKQKWERVKKSTLPF